MAEHGVAIAYLNMVGGQDALVFDGASVVAFKAQGTLSAEGLRQASALGPVARMAEHASGSTTYQASLLFRSELPELVISTNLAGMALSLPAPLAKTAEAVLPLRFENSLLPDSLKPGQMLQDAEDRATCHRQLCA